VLDRTSFEAHLNNYFNVDGGDGGDFGCTFDEIYQYATFFCKEETFLQIHKAVESDGLIARDFTHVGGYLARSYSTSTTLAAFRRYVFD
jgi:hypothetical protein